MKIVVGFIGRPEGRAALTRAAEEARRLGATLVVVHSMRGGGHDDDAEVLANRDSLEQVEEDLTAEGIDVEVRSLVRGQSPAEDLIEIAADPEVHLLVIGVRPRTTVGKLVLGSNAQEVIRRADCDVLCVKAAIDRG